MVVPIVCPATSTDLKAVAGIFAHYATSSILTFEQTPPAVADWRQRLDDLSRQGLPFVVAEIGDGVVRYRREPQVRQVVDTVLMQRALPGPH